MRDLKPEELKLVSGGASPSSKPGGDPLIPVVVKIDSIYSAAFIVSVPPSSPIHDIIVTVPATIIPPSTTPSVVHFS